MKSKKRKARSKIENKESLLVPFDVTKLGSKEDPCFGKEFEPQAEECRKCGDAEFCSIAKIQSLNLLRLQESNKVEFKDEKESALLSDPLNIICDRLKRADGKWVSQENLEKELNRKGITKKRIATLIEQGFFKKLPLNDFIKTNKTKDKFRWN